MLKHVVTKQHDVDSAIWPWNHASHWVAHGDGVSSTSNTCNECCTSMWQKIDCWILTGITPRKSQKSCANQLITLPFITCTVTTLTPKKPFDPFVLPGLLSNHDVVLQCFGSAQPRVVNGRRDLAEDESIPRHRIFYVFFLYCDFHVDSSWFCYSDFRRL